MSPQVKQYTRPIIKYKNASSIDWASDQSAA